MVRCILFGLATGIATETKPSCLHYFGDVSGLVTIVDPDVGLTDASSGYCDQGNVDTPCTYAHFVGGAIDGCISPGPPDGCHRYIKTTYTECADLATLGLTGTVIAGNDIRFNENWALKSCADHVASSEVTCWGPPADDPATCSCSSTLNHRIATEDEGLPTLPPFEPVTYSPVTYSPVTYSPVTYAPAPDPLPAPEPEPSPAPAPTPASQACAANPGCVAMGLIDKNNCCPADDGTQLACCEVPAPAPTGNCCWGGSSCESATNCHADLYCGTNSAQCTGDCAGMWCPEPSPATLPLGDQLMV